MVRTARASYEEEVRIEHPHLGDVLNRQLVAGCGAANRLGVGCVVNAERALAIGCRIGMDPGDSVLGIAGAIVGDALYFILTGADEFLLFSWGALFTEALVALVVVLGFNLLQRIIPE